MFCPVCVAEREPHFLACGHHVCFECTLRLIRTRSRRCPFCRTSITWTVPQLLRAAALPPGTKPRRIAQSELRRLSAPTPRG